MRGAIPEHLALVFILSRRSSVENQFVVTYHDELARYSDTFCSGVRHHKETLQDLIICPEDPYRAESLKQRHFPVWELAAETLSALHLHRFACNSVLANKVRDSMLNKVTPPERLRNMLTRLPAGLLS